jgi:DNA modification methylase
MKPYYQDDHVTLWNDDARTASALMEPQSVDSIVTSPPYFGLRDYGVDGQIGLEPTLGEYVTGLSDTLTSYVDVLKPGGSLWLNLGDSYSTGLGEAGRANGGQIHGNSRARVVGMPAKCLLMTPERVALALIERGWILRNRVVWAKPNGMPTSVKDRLATKHEALFHFVRQQRYFYDLDSIREPHKAAADVLGELVRPRGEPDGEARHTTRNGLHVNGKNPGDVWSIPTQPYPDAHFAVFPPELVRRPILTTVPEGGTVLDPFFGSGTTAAMARKLGRKSVGVELSADYCALAVDRFRQGVLL